MNASECVAKGCALQCAILSPTFKVREFQKNYVDLLTEVQQQQLRAKKLLGNSVWRPRDSGSNKDNEARERRNQAALPSSSDSSILLHIERHELLPSNSRVYKLKTHFKIYQQCDAQIEL